MSTMMKKDWRKGLLLVLLMLGVRTVFAAETPWEEIPPAQWKGVLDAEVPSLKRTAAAAVALPAQEAQPLIVTTSGAVPRGLYEIRFTLRPSHVAGAVAFHAGLKAGLVDGESVQWEGQFFSRAHEPETRIVTVAKTTAGPLAVALSAFADAEATETSRVSANLKQGGPKIGESAAGMLDGEKAEGEELDLELNLTLSPDKAVYYLVDKVEYRALSLSGQVIRVATDKIRYLPGETLKGFAVLADLGGKVSPGTLNLYLEHNVNDRVKVKSLPVTLSAAPLNQPFEFALPAEELGYAIVAEFVSDDGKDHSEAAEYFSIAANFQRVAIFGGGLATRDAILEEDTIREGLSKARAEYINATEFFAWAEDDMVEMSPKTDFWSSGQTNYRMNKQTLKRQISLAHEQGMAAITYGKFVMSGLPGWETAYDYPNDHRGQYNYHVGMWAEVNTQVMDLFRNQDFVCYSKSPNVPGNPFRVWWSAFLPINPDPTPRMARIAAEECIRSIEMFGWDAIRWDGHARAGWNACGQSGKYEAWAARKTQSLVRYFKEIVAAKYPAFRHGYNYFLVEPEKGYDWAVEDFELDELARDGGLLMNESIGNASAGYTFAQIARNLQVEGDLSRERGGFYLGISFAMTPRDMIIESALWGAAGCRPYNSAMTREIRRYCTRYSQYTFDENLRRLAAPGKILAPQEETTLWWQPFVYETPLVNGKRQLVINLLNLPQAVKRPNNRANEKPKPEWDMPAGTAPVGFTLTLPKGMTATRAQLIQPQTLEVAPLPLADNGIKVPSVTAWSVAVIDLTVEGEAPSLAVLCDLPKTLGAVRTGVKETERKEEVVLDPKIELWEVNKRIGELAPEWEINRAAEQAAVDALTGEARDKALLARRQTPEALAKEWWKGAAIPADLALKDKAQSFGDLTPQRNNRFDIYYARGTMDYRLRLFEAFARLPRFSIHDAPLGGAVKQAPGMWLANGIPWTQYPDFDLLLFTGIPHCAIGVENSYALVDYIKAGGGAFFTGGEYAFGKGGYMHTVLEREVLPLQCTGMVDTVYTQTPQSFEPGPDLPELKVALDFTVKPAFWVRNEVVLKPSAKIFLKCGDRPILAGWSLGKGRVICLLVDYRGKSEDGITAFFDWPDWPKLMAAAMAWAAPDAGSQSPPPAAEADAKAILTNLQGSGLDDELGDLDTDDTGGGLALPSEEAKAKAVILDPAALTTRLALIDKGLTVGGGEIAAALAGQLATLGNLPLEMRLRLLPLLRQERPANAGTLGRTAVESSDSILQSAGYLLLAVAGDPSFAQILGSPPTLPGEPQTDTTERLRDLALAVVLYPKPDLTEEGRKRVEAWNRLEAAARDKFATVCGEDTLLLETSPLLDAEALFQRTVWLAYLARHDAKSYGDAFTRQWLMIGQYQAYAWRSIDFVTSELKLTGATAASRVMGWKNLIARFGILRELTQADLEAVILAGNGSVGLAQARFGPEILSGINLLGNLKTEDSVSILSALKTARQDDLSRFALARLTESAGAQEKKK